MASTSMLSNKHKYSLWRLCAWAGPVFLVGYVISWGILGFNVPPNEPSIALPDLYAHYLANSVRIRLAFVLSVFFIPFYFVFSCVVSRLMQTIEGPDGPLAVVEQLGGAATVVVGMVAGICWLTAGYRIEERTPEIVRALHDFGWLFFDTTYMVTGVQMLALGTVFLLDPRSEPLVPRWLCWYTYAVVGMFLPLSLLPFFYAGPFAWSGLFCYWISLGSWFVWLTLLCVYAFRAIRRLEGEESGVRQPVPSSALSPAAALR
jgi:hypothetical protein